MSDRQIIAQHLRIIARRIYLNRGLRDGARALSVVLPLLAARQIWNLLSPWPRMASTAFFLALVLIAIAILLWTLLRRVPLGEAAAEADARAGLRDELKTAHWFLSRRQESAWIDYQIEGAAARIRSLPLDRHFPILFPRGAWPGVVATALLLALNVLPISPIRKSVGSTSDMLRSSETRQLLAEIETALEDPPSPALSTFPEVSPGSATQDRILHSLESLRSRLTEGNIRMAGMESGLEEVAGILGRSEAAGDLADAMKSNSLREAATAARKLASELNDVPDPATKADMADQLQAASKVRGAELDDLLQSLRDAGASLAKGDVESSRAALEKAADDLEELARKKEAQARRNELSERVQDLARSISSGSAAAEAGKSPSGSPSDIAEFTRGEGAAAATALRPPTEMTGEAAEAEETGMSPLGTSSSAGENVSRSSGLRVQIYPEALDGMLRGGVPGEQKSKEAATAAESSRLQYRNARAVAGPHRSSAITPERIPAQYRELVKLYFTSPSRGSERIRGSSGNNNP